MSQRKTDYTSIIASFFSVNTNITRYTKLFYFKRRSSIKRNAEFTLCEVKRNLYGYLSYIYVIREAIERANWNVYNWTYIIRDSFGCFISVCAIFAKKRTTKCSKFTIRLIVGRRDIDTLIWTSMLERWATKQLTTAISHRYKLLLMA